MIWATNEGGRYEPKAGNSGEDYWDAAGGGSCPGTREEGRGGLPRSWGIGAKLRDEVLNREVFFTMKEAKMVIENWPQEYNTIQPHSSLNGLPPAPEAILPLGLQSPQLIRDRSEWGSTLT
jgi:hypothetical protein